MMGGSLLESCDVVPKPAIVVSTPGSHSARSLGAAIRIGACAEAVSRRSNETSLPPPGSEP